MRFDEATAYAHIAQSSNPYWDPPLPEMACEWCESHLTERMGEPCAWCEPVIRRVKEAKKETR